MKVMETVILHASDVIHWVDGSGMEPTKPRLPLQRPFQMELEDPPSDLKLVKKPGATLLWRDQKKVVNGKATDAQKAREAEATYPLKGQIIDASGEFNARAFELTAGNAEGRTVPLYRSPFGTRTGQQGHLYGTLVYGDDQNNPASWALIELTVTTITHPHSKIETFFAQADKSGDFVLSLSGLPFIKKDAPKKTYSAVLTIKGSHAASNKKLFDPDKLEPFKIKEKASNAFKDDYSLELTPDSILRIESKSADDKKLVVLKKT